MSRYKPNCAACQLTRGKTKLRGRVSKAAFRREPGDETLQDIAKELHISSAGMYNHAKKHLSIRDDTPDVREVRVAKKVNDIKVAAQKKVELAIDHDDVLPEEESIAALKDYIRQGHAMIKEGKLNITPQSFLTAVRIDVDYKSKQKDRQVDIIKTMYRFASGQTKEANANSDSAQGTDSGQPIAIEPTGSTDTGPNGPGTVHNEDAGDATARWATRVSEQDTIPQDPHQLADLLEPMG